MTTDIMKSGANITLLARHPSEMEKAQNGLIQWAAGKIEAVKTELTEAEENYEIARKNKWRSSAFAQIVKKTKPKIVFYEKIKQALEAGYYIVPPFPVDLFAIRTDRKNPIPKRDEWKYGDKSQPARALPSGEGRFVSPVPEIWKKHLQVYDPDKGKTVSNWEFFAHEYLNVDFPFKLAKPAVLEQVGKAMKDKLFDQLGALPAFAKADPMVVGQILHWNPNRPPVTFFVSWWLDTADL